MKIGKTWKLHSKSAKFDKDKVMQIQMIWIDTIYIKKKGQKQFSMENNKFIWLALCERALATAKYKNLYISVDKRQQQQQQKERKYKKNDSNNNNNSKWQIPNAKPPKPIAQCAGQAEGQQPASGKAKATIIAKQTTDWQQRRGRGRGCGRKIFNWKRMRINAPIW